MPFPTSPTNDQTFSNPLGCLYKYDSTHKVWNVTGQPAVGIQGATGIQGLQGTTGIQPAAAVVGSGSPTVLAAWIDATTLGNSIVSNTATIVTVDSSVAPGGSLQNVMRLRLDDTGEGNVAGTGPALEFALHDASYSGFMASLAGIRSGGDNSDSGMMRLAIRDYKQFDYGPAYTMQEWYPHQGGRTSSVIYADTTVTGKLRTQDNALIGEAGTSIGVLHVVKDTTANGQQGVTYNVGPIAPDMVRDTTTQMVEFADSFSQPTGGAAVLTFGFPGNYQGLMGHGDVHIYDRGDGNSYYAHFSVRMVSEAGGTVTIDYGDSTQIGTGGGTLMDIDTTGSAGPNYNTILRLIYKDGLAYKSSYDIHLQSLTFP